ncbi:carboxypeptidase regulatory-like domain-containing protein [Candidatus Neomarinimicrobiota bacterium]
MKKLCLMLLVPLLVVPVLSGKEASAGAEPSKAVALDAAAIQQLQSQVDWRSTFQGLRKQDAVVDKAASPVQAARERKLRQRPVPMERSQIERFMSKRWRGERKAFSLRKVMTAAGTIPVEVLDPAGDPVTSYTVGDTIVLRIYSSDPVSIELWVDDGDGLFDEGSDLWFSVEGGDGGDDEINVQDGDMDDEDPTAGVWQITFDTGSMKEGGEIFSIQGVKLFLRAYTDAPDTGHVALDVLPPDATTTVSGLVTMENGDPAPHMVVVAIPVSMMQMDEEPETFFITTSNDTGGYTLYIPDDAAGSDFSLFAFDAFMVYTGYFPDPTWIETYISAGDNLVEMDYVLVPTTALIRGLLLDAESDAGIPGVRIWGGMDGPYSVEGTTDADGYFELPVMPGWWRVDLNVDDLIAAGYMGVHGDGDDRFEVFDFDTVTIDIRTFFADESITGTVTWDDGSPMQGAEIWCDTWNFYTETESGSDGTYTLNVSSALDSLEITDEWGTWTNWGYWVNAWYDDAIAQPGGYDGIFSGSTDIDFTMYPTDVFLSGQITDEFDNPMRWANLNAYTIEDTMGFWTGTNSENDGTYEMHLIGGLTWVIEVYRPEYWGPPAVSDTLFAISGSSPVRNYILPAPREFAAVEGHVFSGDGYPVGDAHVELIQHDGPFYADTFTNPDGSFRFEDVPTFSGYDVLAAAPGKPAHHQSIWVDQEDVYVAFWLGEMRYRVDGFVSGDEGPLGGAMVTAFVPDRTEPVDGTFTDDRGFYEFFLKPGFHSIKAGATGYQLASVDVEMASDTSFDFMLTSAEGMLTEHISGRVTDDQANGLSYVWIGMISDSYIAFTNTDYNGNYEQDLMPGTYTFIFQKEGFLEEWRDGWVVPGGSYDMVMMPEAYLELMSVQDFYPDHGKHVVINWSRNPVLGGKINRFVIWEVGRGMVWYDPYNPEAPAPRFVATVPVHPGWEQYSYVAETFEDDIDVHYMVTGHGSDTWEFWDSNTMGGQSHDDLPPMVPAALAAVSGATDLDVALSWASSIDDPDAGTPVQFYSIYRAAGTAALALVGQSTEPSYADALPSEGSYRYGVTATDFGGNESGYSEEVPYTFLAIAGGNGIPETYALRANYPNPFNPSTTIVYELPEAAPVTLLIYDLTGKQIRTLVNEARSAGYHQAVWDGTDSRGALTATGVYFYRITAGDAFVETRKMVLMK